MNEIPEIYRVRGVRINEIRKFEEISDTDVQLPEEVMGKFQFCLDNQRAIDRNHRTVEGKSLLADSLTRSFQRLGSRRLRVC